MIGNGKTFASFSVNDSAAAKKFYVDALGLELKSDQGGMMELSSNGCRLMVYPKDNHEPATFTVFNLETDDINKSVGELVSKGVKMEIYEGMGQDEKGIGHAMGEGKIAWFKDPAGNILSIVQNEK
ncbi:MAG: VOC family protein [Candidatus Dojkabacteria bacterium]